MPINCGTLTGQIGNINRLWSLLVKIFDVTMPILWRKSLKTVDLNFRFQVRYSFG